MQAFWGEKLDEMKQIGIEYHLEWAAKARYAAGPAKVVSTKRRGLPGALPAEGLVVRAHGGKEGPHAPQFRVASPSAR
jgi:hypothetical protein